MECYLLRARALLREIFYNLSLFLFQILPHSCGTNTPPADELFLSLSKNGLRTKNLPWYILLLRLHAEIKNLRPKWKLS